MDDAGYINDVLEPARVAGNRPPDDLRVRYRLSEPLTPGGVRESVHEVRMCWRRARGQLRFRRLIDRLEGDHLRLVPLFDAAAAGDLRPLRAELKASASRVRQARDEQRARLADAAGATRMLAPGDLTEISATDEEEAAAAAGEAGIEVREPDPLPATPPYAGYQRARDALDALGHPHLLDFLFPGGIPDDLHLLSDRDAAALAAAREEMRGAWARRAHDSNRTSADTVLVALKGDVRALAAYDVITRLRERHARHASDQALLTMARHDFHLAAGEAARLVFAVRSESGVQLAEEMRRRREQAAELRDAALFERDSDTAWLRLTEAMDLAADLPGLAELRAGLTPAPIEELSATAGEQGVALSWHRSASRVGGVAYQVVRCTGRPPRHGEDGVVIAEVADGPEALGATDEAPLANAPLYYGVCVVRERAASGLVITGPVFVRPEVGHVRLTPGDGAVSGWWTVPPEVVRVLVTRAAGSAGSAAGPDQVPAGRTGFHDSAVSNGVTYTYRIAAVYLGPDGEEAVTHGVHAAATPAARPDAVTELAADHDPSGDLLISYDRPASGTVELLALAGPPPWSPGSTISVQEAHRAGRVLPGVPVARTQRRETRRIDAPPGTVLAVTVSGELATVGAHCERVNLAPPRELILQRRGGTVLVGFDWPPGVTEVTATWRAGGAAETARIGKARYQADGGLRIGVAPEAEIEVAVAVVAGALTGTPVTDRLPGRTVVTYDLRRSRFGGGMTITLSAVRPARLDRLVLIAGTTVLPQRPQDGRTLHEWSDLSIVPGRPLRLEVPAVRRVRDRWLRCFADGDVELHDPPVRLLRAG